MTAAPKPYLSFSNQKENFCLFLNKQTNKQKSNGLILVGTFGLYQYIKTWPPVKVQLSHLFPSLTPFNHRFRDSCPAFFLFPDWTKTEAAFNALILLPVSSPISLISQQQFQFKKELVISFCHPVTVYREPFVRASLESFKYTRCWVSLRK